MNINELIKEAKKRYEVGDRFRVVHQPDTICTIKSFDFHEEMIVCCTDGTWHFNLLVTDSPFSDCATVCHMGKWAEKVEPEKTPEQLASELGFKIGDNVWRIYMPKYIGIIKEFYVGKFGDLCAKTDIQDRCMLNKITNKVAIHCPTESDKNFIKSILNIKHSNYPENNVNVCFHVNGSKSFDYEPDITKTHLILSVDKYMQSQGIKPVFVTEDGKNIYEGMKYYKVFNNRYIGSDVCRNNTCPHLGFVYFSTEKEAKNYVNKQLKANTGKFEIGDKVKVTRECESYEGGWSKVWSSEMDECVNGTYKITNEFPMSSDGYRLDCGYWFPEFVLEKVSTKYLADEFQVLKLEPYEDELPTSPKGKLFDTLEEANAYHESVKPNTYTVELPKGYEVTREYVILDSVWEDDKLIDGIFLKLKHI